VTTNVIRAPSALTQLGGMLRYEFLLQWRRRTMLIMTLPIVVVSSIMPLFTGGFMRNTGAAQIASGLSAGEVQRQLAQAILPTIAPSLYVILILLMPVVVSDVIPKDRQHGTRELLDSLPLPIGVYLIGKLLSMCLIVWASLGITMIVIGAMWWFSSGPYDLGIYLGMWVIVVAPLTLINPGVGLLIAAGQPNRRRGVIVSSIFTMACVYLVINLNSQITFWDVLNPGRPILMAYYFGVDAYGFSPSWGDVLLSIGAGLLEVGLVGSGAWLWIRWRSRQ
jgi:ABC-type transport system involved in multi-copper enzyme maturation permease subunit